MNHELTHLDLFSGIGGFKLAAEWTGFVTAGFSEVESHACGVLEKCWPDVSNVGDVRTTANFARFRDGITVLTGGFPCQPWSNAGKQRGAGDNRHLWPAMLGVIKIVRPAWIIGENVPGLDHLGQLDACIDDLAELGYESQPFEIPACAVDAPHLRNRIWIIAHRNGDPIPQLHLGSIESRQQAPRRNDAERLRPAMADAADQHRTQLGCETPEPGRGREALANPNQRRFRRRRTPGVFGHPLFGSRWLPEPSVGRMAHGVPDRSHRLKGLGNAIVPEVAAPFLEWIAQIETQELTQ